MSGHIQEETEMTALAEAMVWRVRLTEAGCESDPDFETWLAGDPARADAWAQVQASWNFLGEHGAEPEVLQVRRAALGRARRAGRLQWRSSPFQRMAAGVAVMGVTVALLGAVWAVNRSDVYQTALGERRVITLADGSRLSLDADTKVKVRLTKHARDLLIDRGQARFDVAHDVERPFSVTARNQKIVATGTAFNIDLLGSQVLVTLIEGKVVVIDETAPRLQGVKPKPLELTSGERLAVAGRAPPKVERVSVERTIAWQTGQLVFDNEPLGAVAARISRYAAHPVLVDPAASALRLSGVFDTGDPESFIDIVTRYLPVRAERRDDGVVVLHHQS